MNPESRMRRLQAELEGMTALQGASSLISFTASGIPPTQYAVHLSCHGLCAHEGALFVLSSHSFDILLGPDFPLLAPTIIWKTPIYHPNFRGPLVCMGDFWYPAWSLADMCTALCEMVQYKTYNIYDPLDKIAAQWLREELEENAERFPVDARPVCDLDFSIALTKEQGADELEKDR